MACGNISSIPMFKSNISSSLISNSTDNAQKCQLIRDSLAQMAPTMIPNGLYVLFGFFAVIFSSATMYVIFKAKRLRTKFFTLLLLSTMVDLTLGISYASLALKRYYRFYGGGDHPSGEVMSVWTCFGEICVNAFSLTCSLSSALALVVDRLIATFRPLTYKQTTRRRLTLPLILLALLFTLIQTLIQLIDAYWNREKIIISCSIQTTNSHQVLQLLTVIQICTSCLVVLLNVYLGILVKIKRKKMSSSKKGYKRKIVPMTIASQSTTAFSNFQKQQQQQEKQQLDKEFKIFKTLTLMTVAHAVMHLGGRVCYSLVIVYADDKVQILVYLYTQSLVVLNAAVHFFLLSFTSSDFRNAASVHLWQRVRQHTSHTASQQQVLRGHGQSTVVNLK